MKKITILALAAVGTAAYAQVPFDFSGGVGGGAIPDGLAANTPGAPVVITLTVSGTGLAVASLDLAGMLGATHTFIGDLTVVLSKDGVAVDLMDRNYRTTATGSGTGSDLGGGDYMFNNTLNGIAGSAGAFQTTGTSPAGEYNRWDNAAFGSSTAPNNYGDFTGIALDGNWVLTITDWWNFDTGAVQGMRIVGNAVPEPATMIVLGAGLAALAARRRRK